MYKIYLKYFKEGAFRGRTTRKYTHSPIEAEEIFMEIISREELIGRKAVAVLSFNNRQLVYHRFDRSPGQKHFVSLEEEITT